MLYNDGTEVPLIEFLGRHGQVLENYEVTTRTGRKENIAFAVEKDDQIFGVWIYDWARSLGVNAIVQVEKKINELKLAGAIVITRVFSLHAKDITNRINKSVDKKIILFDLREVKRILESDFNKYL